MSKKSGSKFEFDSSRNRYFSEKFKRKLVKEIADKKIRIREASELYNVSRTSVYRWVYLYSDIEKGTNTIIQMESEATKTSYYRQQVAELERLYGQKQMEIDYLNKLLELASEELGIDLKKKYAPPRWNGSGLTQENTPTR